MSQLSELLMQANEENPLTLRARSDRVGGALDFTTIGRYQSGRHPSRPDDKTLRLLAAAYSLSYQQVQRAAGIKVGAGPYEPPEEAARLTQQEQGLVSELIKALAANKGGTDDGTPGQKIEFGDLSPESPQDEINSSRNRVNRSQTVPNPQTPKRRSGTNAQRKRRS